MTKDRASKLPSARSSITGSIRSNVTGSRLAASSASFREQGSAGSYDNLGHDGVSFFTVPLDSVASAGNKGKFEVQSTDGSVDLTVVIDTYDPASPHMMVYSTEQSRAAIDNRRPLASVCSAPPDGRGPGGPLRFEVKSADGVSVGLLEERAEGKYQTFMLSRDGAIVMVMEGADEVSLQMRVLNYSGKEVATVCYGLAEPSHEEILQIVVLQGNDPIIVVTTALAVLLLGEEEVLRSSSTLSY